MNKEERSFKYAYALFLIGKEESRVSSYLDVFSFLDEEIKKDSRLIVFLNSRFITNEEKYKFIDNTFAPFKLPKMLDFLKLIVKDHSANLLSLIYREFKKLHDESTKMLEGIIYSTLPLRKEKISELERVFTAKRGHNVSFSNQIDPSLIGGIKIQLGSSIYDDSIANQLARLKNKLEKGM